MLSAVYALPPVGGKVESERSYSTGMKFAFMDEFSETTSFVLRRESFAREVDPSQWENS